MHFRVSAVLPIDARTFLVERDSAAFRALVAKTQRLGALEIEDGWVERVEDHDVQVFKLVTKPDIEKFVPKRFHGYIPGGALEYTDVIRYDPKLLEKPPFKLIVHSTPPVFANRTTIDCELTIEEVSEHECRQTLEGDININVMGLGRIAERIIVKSLNDVYSGIPEIAERWVQFRDEVLKQPDGREVLFNGRPPLQEDWVSEQVATVLQSPYSRTSLASTKPPPAPATPEPTERPAANGAANGTSELDADSATVVATAKPGLDKALPDGGSQSAAAAAARNTAAAAAAASGEAETLQQSSRQQREAAARQQEAGGPPQPQASPFAASVAAAPQEEDEQSVEDRRRSVAVFEGDMFFEPDETLPDLSMATADSLRQDQEEAMTWFREYSVTGQSLSPIAVTDADSQSEQSGMEPGEKRRWWRRTGSRRRLRVDGDSEATGPHRRHYSDWAAFWERQGVAKQEPAPQAAQRLGHLFGLAVKLGLVSPAGGGGNKQDSARVKRTKSVGFATPIVNGVREATPGASDEEDEYAVPERKCFFCLPLPRCLHRHTQFN